MKTLQQDLQTGQFKNIYLLYGEEAYLKDQYKERLKNALIPPEDTMNLNHYKGKGISVQELIDQAETMPFFSERRLLMIEDSGFFKNATAELAEYLEQVPETTYFVFVENEVDKRGKLYKTVKSKGSVVEFVRQTEEMLQRWVLGTLKKEQKNITRNTMELFFSKTGTDMSNIHTELEKLLSYTMGREVITSEDVEEICTTQTTGKVFDMVDSMAEKQQRRALDLYYDLLAQKEPPMRILYLVTRQFHILMQVKELRAEGMDQQNIAQKCGLQSFAMRKYLKQGEHYTIEHLKRLVERAVSLEEDVKNGRINDQLAVELMIISGSQERK
ncbi:MAG: DNA polymerase III subunit delta [Eubacteriales bacterium]|nr:DNA polymerase III subunit delta [Eubacteriales bacterium]